MNPAIMVVSEGDHSAITEQLGDWAWTTTPIVEAVKVVGDGDDGRVREMREVLERLGVPTGVHAPGSPVGRAIVEAAGPDAAYPLVEVMGETVLADPTNREIATVFGAGADVGDVVFDLARAATGLEVGPPHRLRLSDGAVASAHAVILACGVTYRRLGVPSLEDLVGNGVFYGAATSDARALEGSEVVVVGAGNSGGQAAVHLARYAARVTIVARSGSTSRVAAPVNGSGWRRPGCSC